jgi:hypothetical protein
MSSQKQFRASLMDPNTFENAFLEGLVKSHNTESSLKTSVITACIQKTNSNLGWRKP